MELPSWLSGQVVIFITLLCTSASSNQIFTVEPGAGPFKALIGTQVELNCGTVESGQNIIVEWSIVLPGEGTDIRTLSASVMERQQLEGRGITVSNTGRIPTLVIDGNVGNNRTRVQCGTQGFVGTTSQSGEVLFYETSITNLRVIDNGLSSLRFEWRSSLPLQYKVTITSLSDFGIPMEVPGIQNQYYIFTTIDSKPCDAYKFQVSTDPGPPGQEIIVEQIPSVPEITSLVVRHSFLLAQNNSIGLSLTVMLGTSELCRAFLPHNYTVVVRDQHGGVSVGTTSGIAATSEDVVNVFIDGLIERVQYSYYVIATNGFGSSETATVKLTPTTVQDISICQSGRTNYSIQCSYGNNSGVRGCGFVLVSREGENVMGYMEWDWDRGVVLDLPSFDYDNVLVFTLEEGNRIGGVPFRKSNSLIKFCVEYELTPALSSSASAAVIGVLMLSAVVFIVTMWIVYVLRYEQDRGFMKKIKSFKIPNYILSKIKIRSSCSEAQITEAVAMNEGSPPSDANDVVHNTSSGTRKQRKGHKTTSKSNTQNKVSTDTRRSLYNDALSEIAPDESYLC